MHQTIAAFLTVKFSKHVEIPKNLQAVTQNLPLNTLYKILILASRQIIFQRIPFLVAIAYKSNRSKMYNASSLVVHHHLTTMSDDCNNPDEPLNYYCVPFNGTRIFTAVTHDPEVADAWTSHIKRVHRRRRGLICGLDVEWRPSFTRGVRNPVATLQLCVGRQCLIYQLIHSPSIPSSLIRFLGNRNYTFVGVGIAADLKKLQVDYNFGFNVNAVDLKDLAAEVYGLEHLRRAGLKGLTQRALNIDVEKPFNVKLSRWDNKHLALCQVRYACLDAYLSFDIGRVLGASG